MPCEGPFFDEIDRNSAALRSVLIQIATSAAYICHHSTHGNTFQLHRLYKIRDLCFWCRHHYSNLVVSWWDNLQSISHSVLPSPGRMSILNFWTLLKAKYCLMSVDSFSGYRVSVLAWLADSSQATIALKTNVQLSKPFAVWQMVHILSQQWLCNGLTDTLCF